MDLVSSLFFRLAVESDLADVVVNEEASYEVPWRRQMFLDCFAEQFEFWVIEYQGQIVGHIIWQHVLDESHLLNICIVRSHQGKGWGREAMSFWLDSSINDDKSVLLLEVRFSNEPAHSLYLSLGFREVGVRKNYYRLPDDGREDGRVMAKTLCSSESP